MLAAQEPHHGVAAPATGLYALVRAAGHAKVVGTRLHLLTAPPMQRHDGEVHATAVDPFYGAAAALPARAH